MALQIVFWVVFALGVLLITMNWWCLIASVRTKRHISMVPPLGAVLAFVASTELPIGWKLGALAFAIDPGFLSMVASFGWMLVRRERRDQ